MRKAKQRNNLKPKKREVDLIPPQFIIYTDGSADNINEPHHGGSAYIIIDNRAKIVKSEWSQGYRYCTSNQCELNSIIMAIDSLPSFTSALVVTDSKYAITVLSNMKRKYPRNMEYIEQYRFLVENKSLNIKFQWVRGHGSNFFNQRVDKMARQAMYEVEQRFKEQVSNG